MKKTLFIISIYISCTSLKAQDFLPAFDLFSKNKTSYVTLKDGTKLEGEIADLDRKKGNIEEITIKTADKKKHKLKPIEIKEAYLPVSNWEKVADMHSAMFNVKTYSGEIDMDHIAKGYAYFLSTEVQIKKEKVVLLMQVVNPGFSNKIIVYHDPTASETTSFGFAGVTVVGGDDKSYYVQIGNETAFKLKKKDYEDSFSTLYKDCPDVITKYKKAHEWIDFCYHVYECTTGKAPELNKK